MMMVNYTHYIALKNELGYNVFTGIEIINIWYKSYKLHDYSILIKSDLKGIIISVN
jgi:hypothetical protein